MLLTTANNYAYLTNAGNKGSLVVLDLKTGEARQVLVGDRSTFADPSQHLMIGNEVALRPDDSVVAIHADGIALSPDTQWLYYRPLTDHNYWRVPTAALRDAKLSATELSGKVEYLGNSALSGRLIMDASGTLYGGDLEHRTVVALTLRAHSFPLNRPIDNAKTNTNRAYICPNPLHSDIFGGRRSCVNDPNVIAFLGLAAAFPRQSCSVQPWVTHYGTIRSIIAPRCSTFYSPQRRNRFRAYADTRYSAQSITKNSRP